MSKGEPTYGSWLPSNRTYRGHNHPDRFWECHIHTAAELRLVGTANGATLEEAEANARLIAAAPALLEACRDLVDRFDRKATKASLGCSYTEAKRAIAKAEGAR